MTDATIHMRVPAATKARWVRASRAAGMRLTDWVARAVEAQMSQQLTKIIIPDDVGFSDLRLARDSDGMVSFSWTPLERICEASGVDMVLLRDGPEDNVASLVARWYEAHLQAGGEADPIAEDLLAEVRAEGAAGQHTSHTPGRA